MRKTVLYILFLFIALNGYGEVLKVAGTVFSGDEKEPCIGINIHEKERPANGTFTDLDGNFTISVEKGHTLVFSVATYVLKELVVENDNPLNVELSYDSIDEEIWVGDKPIEKPLDWNLAINADACGHPNAVKDVEEIINDQLPEWLTPFHFDKNDLYYYKENEAIHLSKQDNFFEYYWWFWDGFRYSTGHWTVQDNQLILKFDIKPSVDRAIEGRGVYYGNTIVFLKSGNSLIQKKYIYNSGEVNSNEKTYNEVTEDDFKNRVPNIHL